jgi:hypothetical protein
MRREAGVIITFARPKYYRKAMQSLCKCHDTGFDWFVFQDHFDGYPERNDSASITEDAVNENIQITNASSLNIVQHKINERNRGINYQINQAMQLFENYDILYIFEDDLIVSPHYVNLLRRCSEQYPKIVSSFHNIKRIRKYRIPEHLHYMVEAKKPRLWGFYLTKQVWNVIKYSWEDYYYNTKNWCGYDVIFTPAIRKYTYGKFEPLVPRAYCIGVSGMTTNEHSWVNRKLDQQVTDIFYKRDRNLSNFTLIELKEIKHRIKEARNG